MASATAFLALASKLESLGYGSMCYELLGRRVVTNQAFKQGEAGNLPMLCFWLNEDRIEIRLPHLLASRQSKQASYNDCNVELKSKAT